MMTLDEAIAILRDPQYTLDSRFDEAVDFAATVLEALRDAAP